MNLHVRVRGWPEEERACLIASESVSDSLMVELAVHPTRGFVLLASFSPQPGTSPLSGSILSDAAEGHLRDELDPQALIARGLISAWPDPNPSFADRRLKVLEGELERFCDGGEASERTVRALIGS